MAPAGQPTIGRPPVRQRAATLRVPGDPRQPSTIPTHSGSLNRRIDYDKRNILATQIMLLNATKENVSLIAQC